MRNQARRYRVMGFLVAVVLLGGMACRPVAGVAQEQGVLTVETWWIDEAQQTDMTYSAGLDGDAPQGEEGRLDLVVEAAQQETAAGEGGAVAGEDGAAQAEEAQPTPVDQTQIVKPEEEPVAPAPASEPPVRVPEPQAGVGSQPDEAGQATDPEDGDGAGDASRDAALQDGIALVLVPETPAAEAMPDEPMPQEPTVEAEAREQSVSISSTLGSCIVAGESFTLEATLVGFDDVRPSVQWQYDDGSGWQDAQGATGLSHSVQADAQTVNYNWRVLVSIEN